MTIAHILYQFFIYPLELIFEVCYAAAMMVLKRPGFSIVALSLAVNVCLLPLYRQADAVQEEERETENRLSPWVKHIRKTFHGDERFMMLQTYYRQNHYNPAYALKGALPLLLEIPFFAAAYHFLSHLAALNGMPFGPIRDLGAPDGLLAVGGVTIHVLPILMTLVNFLSAAIYTRGLRLKDKLQLYGMGTIFLLLLYNSPSGLVFYWTLNNLFSLVKNTLTRVPRARPAAVGLLSFAGLALLAYALFVYNSPGINLLLRRAALILCALLAQLPAVLPLLRKRFSLPTLPNTPDRRLFLTGCALLTLLTGLLIPSAVIRSSPAEFVILTSYQSPLLHVGNSFLTAAGLFLFWLGLFYWLSSPGVKWLFSVATPLLAGLAAVDALFFGKNPGILSQDFQFDVYFTFSSRQILGNLTALLLITAAFVFAWRKARRTVRSLWSLTAAAIAVMSLANLWEIQSALPSIRSSVESMASTKAHFTLSRNGNNVIVLMLDRAIDSYIPYLFQEKPELREQFTGFTWYPNTTSLGGSTRPGAVGIFGGYEYTPEGMNRRPNELLVSKQNEALKLMPVTFDEAGYHVTVCDPPYANYQWIPDLSIYEDYPSIQTWLTEQGQFDYRPEAERLAWIQHVWSRNFFCYSVMKSAPLLLQPTIYLYGSFFDPASSRVQVQVGNEMSRSSGIRSAFINSYSVLHSLPSMTQISDGAEDTFLMMANSTTHEPTLLQEPEYTPSNQVDNTEYDSTHSDRFTVDGISLRMENAEQMMHYHANMAAFLQLGQWMDYLRDNGVYDNTRIILVADHGRNLGQFDSMVSEETGVDAMGFNALLMVKDFDSQEFSIDERLMTNADVPTRAFRDLIPDPVNPFTGNSVDSSRKESPLCVYRDITVELDRTITTFDGGTWYSVHDDIRKAENWEKIEAP